MATPERDPLIDLERHRRRLEETVTKLRQSLKHWSTWELEYETLKEEIQNAGSPPPEEMRRIARDLGGTLVNEKEVEQLLGPTLLKKRSATQVVDMISHRVDYVQQNIATLTKQLQAAEKKANAASVLLEPDLNDDEGLPLTDIVEELDEEGNVISSSLNQPGKSAAGLMDTLQKAGVSTIEKTNPPTASAYRNASSEAHLSTSASNVKNSGSANSAAIKPSIKSSKSQPTPDDIAFGSGVQVAKTTPKKSVSFSDAIEDTSKKESATLKTAGYNPDLAAFTFKPGQKVIEADENDDEIATYPVIPKEESTDDATLRRQILQYSLNEVGAVVAEIDLDEGMEYSDDDEEYDEEDYDSNVSEEEDEHGLSTRPWISPEYRAEMEALEKKLNAQMIENLGPRPYTNSLAPYADDLRRLVVKDEVLSAAKDPESEKQEPPAQAPAQPTITKSSKGESKKKGVHFAENLDISPAPQPTISPKPAAAATPVAPISEAVLERHPPTTISDTISERAPPNTVTPRSISKPAKVSRFKSARSVTSGSSLAPVSSPPTSSPFPLFPKEQPTVPETPQGPPGKIVSSAVIERDSDPAFVPKEPDELDPLTHQREIEIAYNQARYRLAKENPELLNGGRNTSNDPEDGVEEPEWVEETPDGKVKKVSRFKAARLKGGM